MHRRKEEILDFLAEGVFTVDKNFVINYFNKASERITGFDPDEVKGRMCKQVFQSDLCTGKCPIAEALSSGRNLFDLKSRIKKKDGTFVNVKLNVGILKDEDQNPVGGVVTFRDLSYLLDNKYDNCEHFYGIVGNSRVMTNIFNLIQEIAYTDASVLITGETGTGKEMIANAIQATSKRKNEKYIKVNCAVLPPSLLASELFGHAKGAFTDAVKDRIGRFELADGGTIFLDEIAEMPIQMQAQLLRVIQEGTFERLGESITRKVDVRIIAATNVDIKEAIKAGKFREDLYYRLNVIPIEVPPLRERKEDIPFLVTHFLKKYDFVYKKEIVKIDKDALDILMAYHWPGNIRELENVIEYAVIRTKSEESITLCSLPEFIFDGKTTCGKKQSQSVSPARLLQLLEENHWNKSKVARLLGINRTTLWRWMKESNLT